MIINNIKTNSSRPRRIAPGAMLLALSLATTPATQAAEVTCANAPDIAAAGINCFKPNTPAKSREVNANFEYLLIQNNNLQQNLGTVQQNMLSMQQRLADLEAKLTPVSYDAGKNELLITKANVYIVNGTGSTATTNGTGNLIIGYNKAAVIKVCSDGSGDTESTCNGIWGSNQRQGSHNLVIGDMNQYTQYGGLVAGWNNAIVGQYASVSGGRQNIAAGSYSSVTSGHNNTASGEYASISGGYNNIASGKYASVSGGYSNTTSGESASISGGNYNTASGASASVSGGSQNTASANYASVSGGYSNKANNEGASVSGGYGNTASGGYASVKGGAANTAAGSTSSVNGGQNNIANNDHQVIP